MTTPCPRPRRHRANRLSPTKGAWLPIVSMLAGLSTSCSDLQGNSPVNLPEGYVFPGLDSLEKSESGSFILSWKAAPVPGLSYRIFRRQADGVMNWERPFKETQELVFETEDLRFSDSLCFAVRVVAVGADDQNTAERCTEAYSYRFPGVGSVSRLKSGRFELTWESVPLEDAEFTLLRSDESANVIGEPLQTVRDTRVRVGPFALGETPCFIVRLSSKKAGIEDLNQTLGCVNENRMESFKGIESAASLKHGEVTLSWTPAVNDYVIGYFIYEGSRFDKTVMKVDGRYERDVTIAELEPFSTKTYGVRAISSFGTEDLNTRLAQTQVMSERPIEFQGLESAQAISSSRVKLDWAPQAYAKEYRIYWSIAEPGNRKAIDYTSPQLIVEPSQLSPDQGFIVDGLGDDLSYQFAVRSVSLFGQEDSNRKERLVTTPDVGPPSFGGISKALVRGQNIILEWDDPIGQVSRFRLYRSEGPSETFESKKSELPFEPGSARQAVVSGFKTGQSYTFLVLAEDRHGRVSLVKNLVTLQAASQTLPVFYGYSKAVGLDERRVAVTFKTTPEASVDKYAIRHRELGQTAWALTSYLPQNLSVLERTHIVSSLKPDTDYEFLVTVWDRWGNESENTLTIKAKTLDVSPPSFDGVLDAFQPVGESVVRVRWLASVSRDIGSYRVFYSPSDFDATQVHLQKNENGVGSASVAGVQVSAPIAPTETETTLTGLLKGQDYWILVRAFDLYGNEDRNNSLTVAKVRNTFPILDTQVTEREGFAGDNLEPIALSATDPDLADPLNLVFVNNGCEAAGAPVTLLQESKLGDRVNGSVRWIVPAGFIQEGSTSRECSVTLLANDGESDSAPISLTFRALNRAPENLEVSIPIPPTGFYRNQTLNCLASATDADGDELDYTYSWLKNDVPIPLVTSASLTPAQAQYLPGDRVRCAVMVSDGHEDAIAMSQEVTMGNVAPNFLSVFIKEDGAALPLLVTDRISCKWNGLDLDGDPIAYGALSVQSFDGTEWSTASLHSVPCDVLESQKACFALSPSVRHRSLRCSVDSASDGFITLSQPFRSDPIVVANTQPTLSNVQISHPGDAIELGTRLVCQFDFADADLDPLSTPVQYKWLREGVEIPSVFDRSYTLTAQDRFENLACEVTLPSNADGFGSAAVGPLRSDPVRYDNSNPIVSGVSVSPDSAVTGTELVCSFQTSDPDGDSVSTEEGTVQYQWYVDDGTVRGPLFGGTQKTYTVTPAERGKALSCEVTLNPNADGSGSTAVGPVASANAAVAFNSPPVIMSVGLQASADPVRTQTSLTCSYEHSDPDGDPLSILPAFSWTANGTKIAAATSMTYSIRSSDRGKEIRCGVEFLANSDGKGAPATPPVYSQGSFVPVNTDPELKDVLVNSLFPNPHRVGQTFTCTVSTLRDADGDPLSPQYSWFANGAPIDGATLNSFVATSNERNKSLSCAISLPNGDGKGSPPLSVASANGRLIENRAPDANFSPTLSVRATAQANFHSTVDCKLPLMGVPSPLDPDNDALEFRYIFLANGARIAGIPAGGITEPFLDLKDRGVQPGDSLSCRMVLDDGLTTSTSESSSTLTVQNLPPLVTGEVSLSPATIFNSNVTSELSCVFTGTQVDPEGFSLNVSYRLLNGTVPLLPEASSGLNWQSSPNFESSSTITWAPGQDLSCDMSIQDSGGGAIILKSEPIIVANLEPEGSFVCDEGNTNIVANPGNSFPPTAPCSRTVVDLDGDVLRYSFDTSSGATTCDLAASGIQIDTITGAVSGRGPESDCQLTVLLKDQRGAATRDELGNIVKHVFQVIVPFRAELGLFGIDDQCILRQQTSFSDGFASFANSNLIVEPNPGGVSHTGPGTSSGEIAIPLGPGSGGTMEVDWEVEASDGIKSFGVSLIRQFQIETSVAFGEIGTTLAQPGLQNPPATSGSRSFRCPLDDCTGSLASIAPGENFSCAVGAGGDVYCWGSNSVGQLGLGTSADQPSFSKTPRSVDLGGLKAKRLTAGGDLVLKSNFACASLTDATEEPAGVFCWGDNSKGQLGRGTIRTAEPFGSSVPSGVMGLPSDLPEHEIVGLSAGKAHVCALTKGSSAVSGGGVYCWGRNNFGQVGDGSRQDRAQAVPVAQFNGSGALGIAAGGEHTCAITNIRRVKCWGNNSLNQLGVPVTNLSQPWNLTPIEIPGLSNVVALAAGFSHTCALRQNGEVKCWGSLSVGQVGIGKLGQSQNSPAPAMGGVIDKAIAIAAGGDHSCALKQNGALYCWGSNTQGQVGNEGDRGFYTSPQQVLNVNSSALAIASGAEHNCVLLASGELRCFGSNVNNRLGLTVGQKSPQNNAMPNSTATPPVPAAESLRCPSKRAYNPEGL